MAFVDARKLKDSAAEYLKKSKFEKAAEVLEQLVEAEPKDIQHRLRLGDCYRKLEQPQKSIAQYDAAGRYYADQGQLIKAIAAVKVVLEIDPRNADAQKQLAQMNERRLGKVTPENAGLAGVKRAAVGRIAAVKAIPEGDTEPIEAPELPDDAILDDGPEDLAASADDEEVVAEPARPIADLLGSDAEEEIELLSISSDRAGEREADATGQDLEAAFGAIVPDAKAVTRKVPARVPLFDDLPR